MKQVENVEITCLVDNNVDLLLPSTEVARRPTMAENWYAKPLIGEHGFCALLTTTEANGSKHMLMLDSGLDPFASSYNAEVLALDLSRCESVISSHGHVDHTGGLVSVSRKLAKKIPIAFHPEAFRNRMVKFPDGRTINLPAPSKSQLADSGYEIVEAKSRSLWMNDTTLVTGEIPRINDFESGFPNHFSDVDGKLEADPLIMDDQAVVVSVKDKGLVILTGCGHAGIINTVEYAKEIGGEDKVHAVVGGLHLSGRLFESRIGRTSDELERLKPRYVVPCHCSGFNATIEIAKKMPDGFIQNSVGTTYVF